MDAKEVVANIILETLGPVMGGSAHPCSICFSNKLLQISVDHILAVHVPNTSHRLFVNCCRMDDRDKELPLSKL